MGEPPRHDSSDTVPIPDEVLAKFRESESCRVATAVDVVEEIVRNNAGPERMTCPCCGMPDSVTPERVTDYLNYILFGGKDTK